MAHSHTSLYIAQPPTASPKHPNTWTELPSIVITTLTVEFSFLAIAKTVQNHHFSVEGSWWITWNQGEGNVVDNAGRKTREVIFFLFHILKGLYIKGNILNL